MTQKEKAKRYDEAIERARALNNGEDVDVEAGTTICEYIFPELKESEDERILELIKKYVHYNISDMALNADHITREQLEDWLEKQSKHLENYDEAEKEKADFVGDGFIECHADFLDFKEGKTYWLEYIGDDKYNVRSDNLLGKTYHITPCQLYTVFKKLTWLEKQSKHSIFNVPSREVILAIWDLGNEWKELTNGCISTEYGTQLDYIQKHWEESEYYLREKKIEPKFKVGDWVVFNGLTLYIKGIIKGFYITISKGGITNSYDWDIDNVARLWTIQDAKDGDLLVCDINKAEIGGDVEKLPNIVSTIFIFKNVVSSRDYIHSYCHLYDRHVLGVQNTMYYNSFVYNIHPATKEQRDLLFQTMKDAGYEWDDMNGMLIRKNKSIDCYDKEI